MFVFFLTRERATCIGFFRSGPYETACNRCTGSAFLGIAFVDSSYFFLFLFFFGLAVAFSCGIKNGAVLFKGALGPIQLVPQRRQDPVHVDEAYV